MNTDTSAKAVGRVYGYCRVSTREQNLDRQLIAMREFGIPEKNIVTEKLSGKDFDRPGYLRLVRKLRPGDLLVLKSIDRLGRNYSETSEQWRHITKVIGADIVVLDMPSLDTRQDRNLTGVVIADLVLQLLAYVAQTEREYLRQRTKEGMDAAKARGVKFGAQRKPLPENFDEVYEEWLSGSISARDAAARTGVVHSTFLRWAHERQSADSGSDLSV